MHSFPHFSCSPRPADPTAPAATIVGATAATPRLISSVPILRIFDVAKAMEFYIDFLGFSVDWEHRFGENFPLYA